MFTSQADKSASHVNINAVLNSVGMFQRKTVSNEHYFIIECVVSTS